MNNLFQTIKIVLVLSLSICWLAIIQKSQAQETQSTDFAGSLPYDSLVVVRIPDCKKTVEHLETFDLHPILEMIDSLSTSIRDTDAPDEAEENDLLEDAKRGIEKIVGVGSATLVATQGASQSLQWSIVFDRSGVQDLDGLRRELISIQELVVGLGRSIGYRVSLPEDTSLTLDPAYNSKFEIARFPVFAGQDDFLSKEIYCSVIDNKVVLATSADSVISILKCMSGEVDKTLQKKRAFLLTWSHLLNFNADPDAVAYLDARQLSRIANLESLARYDNFLPSFLESVPSSSALNGIAGAGVQIAFKDSQGSDQPSLVVQGVIRTTFPRPEFLEALRAKGEIQLPRLNLNDWKLEEIQASCIDYQGMYDALISDLESIEANENESSPDEMGQPIKRVENKYQLAYRLEELFDKLGDSYWMARARKNGEKSTKAMRCFKFRDEADAIWFAQQKSMSGYLNRTYPLEETELNGIKAFVRPADVAKDLEAKFGKKSNSEAILVADKWCLIVPPDLIEPLTEAVGFSMFFPTKLETLFRKVEVLSKRSDKPFYSMYWSPRRWGLQQQGLAFLLNFEKSNRSLGGVSHKYAPKKFSERVWMTSFYHLRQSLVNKLGESVAIAFSDDNSIQVFAGFFPTGGYKLEGEIADFMDYLPSLKEEQDE